MSTDHAGRVHPSEHARLRWVQRAGRRDLPVAVAWDEATPLDVTTCGGVTGDELRLHDATDTVLVRKEGELTTVLTVGHMGPEMRQAIRRARAGGRA